jgi:hypothetical protein
MFHLHRQVGVETYIYLSMKMEETESSETLAYKIQTPGNLPRRRHTNTEFFGAAILFFDCYVQKKTK